MLPLSFYLPCKKLRGGVDEALLKICYFGTLLACHKRDCSRNISSRNYRNGGNGGSLNALSRIETVVFGAVAEVLSAALHEFLKLSCNAAFVELLFGHSCRSCYMVFVKDNDRTAGYLAHYVRDIAGILAHFTYCRVLLENDLALAVGVDLKRVALTDNIDTKDIALACGKMGDSREVIGFLGVTIKICVCSD